jgi:hypothetical protein
MTGLLVTIRPGPVLHLWQDGREVARVPLDTTAQERPHVTHPARRKARHGGPTGGRCEGAAAGNCDTVTAEGGASAGAKTTAGQ